MAIKADTRYTGKIVDSGIYEAMSGTLGYQLCLECEDGATDYVIWLTPKNKEKAEKAFTSLGIDPKDLRTELGIEGIAPKLAGMEVAFGTKAEEYQGKVRVKVAWVGKPKDGAGAGGSALARAAAFFGGAAVDPDESVPF